MEKRIKTLYIITIIAIISFLGMQIYWLYGRYEYALNEYERMMTERIVKCVDEYNFIRERKKHDNWNDLADGNGKNNTFIVPSFSLQQKYADTVETTRTAKISIYQFSAYDLLGIEPGTPLSEEQKNKAMELAQVQMTSPADSIIFDASGAKDENEAWIATKNVQTERKSPFTAAGIDSVLNNAGIKARIALIDSDSVLWKSTVVYHDSAFRPSLSMTVPYSQLEGKAVTIVCQVNPFDVLPGMWQTLIISAVISTLLIVCLLLQFSTVLKLSRLDKMRNSFITTMIHELKRPISTLKMCVSGIENEKIMTDTNAKTEIVAATRGALDSLSSYFSRLRDMTFNNVEQIPLNISVMSLHRLVDSVIGGITLPGNKDVAIVNETDRRWEISADRTHMFNILNNLIENAIKYSGENVTITVAASMAADKVEIRVTDDGNGISSTDIKHIFERFYRGRSSAADMPGMGLGLAYVRLLVNAHGGEVYVDSTEGRGSCFTIIMPQ